MACESQHQARVSFSTGRPGTEGFKASCTHTFDNLIWVCNTAGKLNASYLERNGGKGNMARCQEGGEQHISHVSPHTVYDARQQS